MTEEERIIAHREADKRWREKRMASNPFKKCTRCGKIKPLDDFKFIFTSKGSNRKFGSICKKCKHEKYLETKEIDIKRAKEYYKNNKEHVKKLRKERYRNNIEKILFRSARERARKKNIDFNIDITDIVIPDKCPVLGMPFTVGNNRPVGNSPTVDRIIPSKGYVKGNIMVISYRANTIKSDARPQELMQVAMFYCNLEKNTAKMKMEGKM